MDKAEFLQTAHSHMKAMLENDGEFWPPHAWRLTDEGVSVYCLAMDEPSQCWDVAMAECSKPDTLQMLFGLDRHGKPGQGTTLQDLVAGFYYEAGAPQPFRPFIVEYASKPEPRVLWFNWDNAFWCAAIEYEKLTCIKSLQAMLAGKKAAHGN